MNLRIIKKSIGGSTFQKILNLLTIVLTTLLLSCMLNITLGIGNQISKDLRGYGSNIVVLPKGATLSVEVGDTIYSPLLNESYLEESKLHLIKEIFWRNNITAFAPFLDTKITLSSPKSTQVILTGTYFDKNIGVQDEPDFTTGVKNLYPMWNLQGKWIEDDSLDSVLIGNELAKRENLHINDTLKLTNENNETFEVKINGILSHSGIYDNRILSSLRLAQKIIGKENVFAKAEVSAFTIPENDLSYKARRNVDSLNSLEFDKWYCSAFVSSIVYQIEEDFKGASAKAQIKVSDAESSIVSKIQGLMGVVSVICLFVASIGIGSLLSAEFQRRKKEIALFKVLGANLWQIYLIFAVETCFISIIGAVIGFFLGLGISQIISWSIFSHFISISWIALPLCIAFAVLISLCGSLVLLKNIMQLLPARILYGSEK